MIRPLILILDNIRSTHNVGSILRSADCFNASEVVVVGYTPYPKILGDTRLPHLAAKTDRAIHKTALGAEQTVPVKTLPNITAAISYARTLGYKIAALEQSSASVALDQCTFNGPLALILGNEVCGIANETLTLCDIIVEIGQHGHKESLNVSAAAAIALYAWREAIMKTNETN